MSVNLGVHIGQQNMTMDELLSVARRVDSAGLDWISLWDHIYEVPPAGGTQPHFEAVSALGAVCAVTNNARIGCLVFYVGYRNPALLAKAATTLDHISGGRFELGIGAGWHEWEAEAYGYDFPSLGTRLDMLEEAAPLVRSLLNEERTTYDGSFFSASNASNLPAPVRGRLPLWIGGIGERRTLQMTARYADGWNGAYVSATEFGRLNGVLDEWCEKVGRDPAEIERSTNVMFHLSSTVRPRAEVEADMREAWGPMADRVIGGALIGTPDEAAELISEFIEAGADSVNVALRAPWDEEALDAYIEQVVPALRKAHA